MDSNFIINGKPVFFDRFGVLYYIDDLGNKIPIPYPRGGIRTRTITVDVPIPPTPVLSGIFTLSANGNIATINSIPTGIPAGSPPQLPTYVNTGNAENLRVRIRLDGIPASSGLIGSFVSSFNGGIAYGKIVAVDTVNNYIYVGELSTIGGGNWAMGGFGTALVYNSAGVTSGTFINITPLYILTIPTSQSINNIVFTARDTASGTITSVGSANSALVQSYSGSAPPNSNPLNGFVSSNTKVIGIGNNPLVVGFEAQVTAINFATANSANNYELTWTKTGAGIGVTVNWTIS